MTVVYEDNHIIVVNKTASEIVQADKTGDTPLSETVKQYLKEKYQKPGNVFLGVTHRLDRPVSGLVIFAKTSKALTRLNEMFRTSEVKKTYWAVVKNAPKEPEGELVHFLVRNEKQNKSYAYDKEVPNSKKAILHYRLIGHSENYYLLEVDLKTGRHHQIRCQLAKMGCPIKGDLKYGSPRSNPDGSICLHARRVRFIHPVSKELIELEAPLPISLCEQEDSYTFSGKNVTMGGATVTYSGAITPKTMKLDLDVVIPQSKWKKSYGISNFTKGKKMTVTYSGGQYVWKETNEILTGGFYVHLDDVELTKAGSTLFLRMKLIQNALCYFIPQLLQTITLQPDGNLVANYTTSPVYIGSVPINNIDPDKDVGTIATFVTKFMIGLLTEKDINNALTDRTWTASPINLITWTEKSGRLKINLNLPAIISLATKDGETPIDSGLVSGIMEALAQSNPVQLKLLLGIVNSMIDNPLLGIITSMDTASFQQVFYLLTEGIIFHIEEEDGHTHLYLTKESTTAFIQLLPGLQPIVEGMLPESMANNTVFKNLLGLLMGNDENGLPVLWNAANTIDLGLDLLPQE